MRTTLLIPLLLAASLRLPAQIVRLDGTKISSDSLTHALQDLCREAGVQGMAISVFNKGKAVYTRTFGYKRLDTKEPLGRSTNLYGASLSKAVFSVIVMKLVEEKVITLDRPLQSYLPKPVYEYGPGKSWNQDYSSLKDDTLYSRITARMCLTHTSGFLNWRWDDPDGKLRVHYTPGAHYSYSGEGLCYLQFVLEKLTGKPLEQLAAEILFRPLKMTRTAYTWKPAFEKDYASGHGSDGKVLPKDKDNAPRSASTLETTLDDYTRFLEAVLQRRILRPASYEQLFSLQIRIRSRYQMRPESWKDSTDENDGIQLGYALGWGYLQTPYGPGVFKEGHGDGFQHYSILFPDQYSGILIMTNSDNGEKIFRRVLRLAIADRYTPWKWEGYGEKDL